MKSSRLSPPPLGLTDVRSVVAVDPSPKDFGDPQPLVERGPRELRSVPGVGIGKAVRPVSDWFDEPRHDGKEDIVWEGRMELAHRFRLRI